ncbi:MAG: hypothetical protein LBS81_00825 [Endomicrobium sp.]|jgi:hypothetical protein|nr:hypothetical protein [Endomicrobium sp.]
MPKDLFAPNATTHTAVAVFETNRQFDYGKDDVLFYDLREDGFVLSKQKGRTGIYGKWGKIQTELLDSLDVAKHKIPDEITFVKTKIQSKDKWTISNYMIFQAKKDLGIINDNLSESELLEILGDYYRK